MRVLNRLESEIEQSVVDWWQRQGGMVLKLNVIGRKGWPDRMFLDYNGRAIFIEFKRPAEKSRALQAHIHKLLKSRGFQVYVCDNAGDAKKILGS
jgi:sulfur relay (sulfurtransferase) complex TusBCD TusD component (DsrE family)